MSLLRYCNRLFSSLSQLPRSCQVRTPSNPFQNPLRRGYVLRTIAAFSSARPRKFSRQQISELEYHLLHLSACLSSSEIPLDHLLSALRLYSSLDEPSQDSGLLLLSCCRYLWTLPLQEQQKLTQQVWKLLTKKSATLTLDHYHTLLNVCAHNRTPIDPEKFLNEMQIQPEEETFILLLKLAGRTGDLTGSAFILSKMKDLMIPLSPLALRALLEVHLASGDMEEALQTFNSIRTAGVQPESSMLACLAQGYAARGDIPNVLKYLSSTFDTSDLTSIINALSISSTSDDVIQVLKSLDNQAIEEISRDPAFRATIDELVQSGMVQDASSIVKYLINFNNKLIKPVSAYLISLIRHQISQEFIMREFQEFKGLVAVIDAAGLLRDLCGEILRWRKDLAMMIFGVMKGERVAIRAHYFWPLLAGADESAVFGVLEEMGRFEVGVDHETLVDYVLPRINVADASVAVKRLRKLGIDSTTAITGMICYLLRNGTIRDAAALVETTESRLDYDKIVESLVENYKLTRSVEGCADVLKKAPKTRDYAGEFLVGLAYYRSNRINEETLRKYVDAFKKRGIVISSSTADYCTRRVDASEEFLHVLGEIVDERVKKSNVEIITGIVHPREMNLEQLECHLIELKTKQLNYSGLLRKLFIAHCKKGNLARVEEIRSEFEALGGGLTPSMKAHLFEVYSKVGRVDEACELLKDLKENHADFEVDSFKILLGAKALVEQGRVETALEIVEGGRTKRSANYEAWMLLDAVSRSEEAGMVDRFLEVLVERGFCKVDGRILGPLVRRFSGRGEWDKAVEAFFRVFEVHGALVLKQELVEGLMAAGKENLMGSVVGLIKEVKGEGVGDQYLVSAYAKLGRKKELRELLRKFGSFQQQFIKLGKTSDTKTRLNVLSNILEASEDIDGFNRDNIYELILSCHIENGDYQAVRDLWDRVAEDINSSKIFKQKFLRLMSSHKVPPLKINEKI